MTDPENHFNLNILLFLVVLFGLGLKIYIYSLPIRDATVLGKIPNRSVRPARCNTLLDRGISDSACISSYCFTGSCAVYVCAWPFKAKARPRELMSNHC